MLAAGIGVGILIIPLIASISEDALRAVPAACGRLRTAWARGRSTTSVRVVVPAAVSGIVAAFIIGISRAIGETMVVAIARAAPAAHCAPATLSAPVRRSPQPSRRWRPAPTRSTGGRPPFLSLFFLGLVLFGITLGLNILGDIFVRRTRQRY